MFAVFAFLKTIVISNNDKGFQKMQTNANKCKQSIAFFEKQTFAQKIKKLIISTKVQKKCLHFCLHFENAIFLNDFIYLYAKNGTLVFA